MCGITGIWHLDGAPVNRRMAERFTSTVRHRGPDGQGIYVDQGGSLVLGNRRLAILDRQARGNQPMSYGNGRLWITFNGEIYNYLEIRAELRQAGYDFITETDTETILAAYLKWGYDCQFKFNGMWAFALWDTQEQTLFLSRDRFGVKPLYTYYDGQRFAFASEVKAFLALAEIDPAPDLDYVTAALATAHYLQATEATLLKAVKRLRAGHSLILQKDGSPRCVRWWHTLDHLATVPTDFNQQAALFRELLDDACRLRLRSDAPIAVSLSGGMDSTSVLATLHQVGGHNNPRWSNSHRPTAYVATFPDRIRDERRYAELLVQALNIPTHYEPVGAQLTSELLDQMLFHAEDINSVQLANWTVYAAMQRDGIPVAMTGDGSDELFVAYPTHIQAALAESLRGFPSWQRYREILRIQQSMLSDVYPTAAGGQQGLGRTWQDARTLFAHVYGADNPTEAQTWAGAAWLTCTIPPVHFADFAADSQRIPRERLLARRLYFDFHYGILPWILHSKDLISMAHGVEIRSPFMDWRIVCFAFALPSRSLLGDGLAKRLLRTAMSGRLPEAIRTRSSKISFVDSETSLFWQMKPLVLETIQHDLFLHSPLWDGQQLRRVIEQAYQTGNAEHSLFFWKCIKTARLLHTFKQIRNSYEQEL